MFYRLFHVRSNKICIPGIRMRPRMASSKPATMASKTEPQPKLLDSIDNFREIMAGHPKFDHDTKPIEVTRSPDPQWTYGEGVRIEDSGSTQPHREIDPYAPDRHMNHNYRLLISGIAPRPIGFISTVAADGKSKNLSPFSYFQLIDHDPPMFVVGFSSRVGRVKDTYRNLKETGQAVINTVSENMIEAVNATSIDAPYGVSEWDISGLHEAPTTTVKPSRVRESILSVESEVIDIKEFTDHAKSGRSVAGLVLLKATRFWVREDAINADGSHIDLNVLRPLAQLGGMSYGRITSTFEVPRQRWEDEHSKDGTLARLITPKSH